MGAELRPTFQTRPVMVAGRRGIELSTDGFTVMVHRGRDQDATASLTAASLTVGTDASCELVLKDPTVSRRHVLFKLTREGIVAEDLSSRNGTWLSGVQIRSAYVPDGSLLRIGDTELRVNLAPRQFVVFPEAASALFDLLGRSQPMRELFAVIQQVSRTDLPVLVIGETGTGKELVARAVHRASPRAGKPFIVLDCGSIVPELLRSELFGHEKGAFTGADRLAKGVLEEADGGTVFLDEIGELPLAVQPNLLRALENREVTRLGSRQPRRVDFRIVAATNKDLAQMCQEGRFRVDLYFRVACVTITPPPLRERLEDLPLLVDHFLENFAQRNHAERVHASAGALRALATHRWCGNVRELRQMTELLAASATDRTIDANEVEAVLCRSSLGGGSATRKAESVEEAERAAIERAMQACGGNKREAARVLKMSRSTLYVKLMKYRLSGAGSGKE